MDSHLKTPWTPGPWTPCRLALGQRVFWVVISRDGRLPETEGNANIQAAAPEMAELLKNCSSALTYALLMVPQDDPLYRKLNATESAIGALLSKLGA